MMIHQSDRKGTPFFNSFLEEYFKFDKLAPFYQHDPNNYALDDLVNSRQNFGTEDREKLVSVLKEQYSSCSHIKQYDRVSSNIGSLLDRNSYTVTTGQQIHVGLGPLYVLYKALDVLALCTQFKDEKPECNFIPVFWLASEDHDLSLIHI